MRAKVGEQSIGRWAVKWAAVLGLFVIVFAANWRLVGGESDQKADCARRNDSCHDCLQNSECYWCSDSSSCHHWDMFSSCGWQKARWHNCWMNVEALVISCCVIGGIIILALCWCCCSCKRCCNRRRQRQFEREEEREMEQERARIARNEERSNQRRAQTDAIRAKYGIPSSNGPPYDRMENSNS